MNCEIENYSYWHLMEYGLFQYVLSYFDSHRN